MIVVTGARGFIGSNLAKALSERGKDMAFCVDDEDQCVGNPSTRVFDYREAFTSAWDAGFLDCITPPDFLIHLGAVTSTTATDEREVLDKNVSFSTRLWDWCTREKVPLIYASSAAVYGDGSCGFDEDPTYFPTSPELLSLYARSKLAVDWRCMASNHLNLNPPFWAGLRFFNVYGPGEEHKGEMASFAYKCWKAIKAGERVEIFNLREQPRRDFVHVADCVDVMLWLMEHKPASGIYNVGTGEAESFPQVLSCVLDAMGIEAEIGDHNRLIDFPETLVDGYQHFTQADISKLRAAGYDNPFRSLREGVRDYVRALETASSSRPQR
jgi:ADP-L-glycero-D-manno-heptose 6-epimerase